MKINYNNKKFRPVQNSDNGAVSAQTVFEYKQEGNILTAIYSGGEIVKGQLIGLVDENGKINMRYQQVNKTGLLQTGICESTPEVLGSGKIRLHEKWKWTSGDCSQGTSILEEV